jgi:hypothetical protein
VFLPGALRIVSPERNGIASESLVEAINNQSQALLCGEFFSAGM